MSLTARTMLGEHLFLLFALATAWSGPWHGSRPAPRMPRQARQSMLTADEMWTVGNVWRRVACGGMLLPLLLLPALPACGECEGNACGLDQLAVSAQDMSVAGADNSHFATGRSICSTYASGGGYNNVFEKWREFGLALYLPGDRPRYLVTMKIQGYQGPGSFSTADARRYTWNPAAGPIILFDVYKVPRDPAEKGSPVTGMGE